MYILGIYVYVCICPPRLLCTLNILMIENELNTGRIKSDEKAYSTNIKDHNIIL